MNALVFKTNIDTEQKFNYVNYLFHNTPQIERWSIDRKDPNKLLKVVLSKGITNFNLIEMLRRIHVHCEELV